MAPFRRLRRVAAIQASSKIAMTVDQLGRWTDSSTSKTSSKKSTKKAKRKTFASLRCFSLSKESTSGSHTNSKRTKKTFPLPSIARRPRRRKVRGTAQDNSFSKMTITKQATEFCPDTGTTTNSEDYAPTDEELVMRRLLKEKEHQDYLRRCQLRMLHSPGPKALSRYYRYPRDPHLSPLRPFRLPTNWPDHEVVFHGEHDSDDDDNTATDESANRGCGDRTLMINAGHLDECCVWSPPLP